MKKSDKNKISKALGFLQKAEESLSKAEDSIYDGETENVSESMTTYDIVKQLRQSAVELRKDIESSIKLFEDL